jgi:hypothetical protein
LVCAGIDGTRYESAKKAIEDGNRLRAPPLSVRGGGDAPRLDLRKLIMPPPRLILDDATSKRSERVAFFLAHTSTEAAVAAKMVVKENARRDANGFDKR